MYIGIYTARKLAQVNFLWGKNDVSTVIQQFYIPHPQKKNFYIPQQISGYAPAGIINGGFGIPNPQSANVGNCHA